MSKSYDLDHSVVTTVMYLVHALNSPDVDGTAREYLNGALGRLAGGLEVEVLVDATYTLKVDTYVAVPVAAVDWENNLYAAYEAAQIERIRDEFPVSHVDMFLEQANEAATVTLRVTGTTSINVDQMALVVPLHIATDEELLRERFTEVVQTEHARRGTDEVVAVTIRDYTIRRLTGEATDLTVVA